MMVTDAASAFPIDFKKIQIHLEFLEDKFNDSGVKVKDVEPCDKNHFPNRL